MAQYTPSSSVIYLCHGGHCFHTPGSQFSQPLSCVLDQPSCGRLILLSDQRVNKGTYEIKRQQELGFNWLIKLSDNKAEVIFKNREG